MYTTLQTFKRISLTALFSLAKILKMASAANKVGLRTFHEQRLWWNYDEFSLRPVRNSEYLIVSGHDPVMCNASGSLYNS